MLHAVAAAADDDDQTTRLHLPIGYHGRASSLVVSGAPVTRPRGQVLDRATGAPVMRPAAAVDFELEVACVVGAGNALGDSIAVDDAYEHLFGLMLMNDWSARDVQQWEMLPLGPFNSKNWVSRARGREGRERGEEKESRGVAGVFWTHAAGRGCGARSYAPETHTRESAALKKHETPHKHNTATTDNRSRSCRRGSSRSTRSSRSAARRRRRATPRSCPT